LLTFFSNTRAKYFENPTMLSRVTAKNVGDVLFETYCSTIERKASIYTTKHNTMFLARV